MGMKFLNKKGWHTGSLRNIENVWKAEQKHDQEQKKLEELRKQIVEERERAEFRQLQEQAGLVPRQERLDFLYDSGLAVGKSSEGFKSLEAFPKTNEELAAAASSSAAVAEVSDAPGALFEVKPQSANDAWRKLHSDPLLMIRQREQEALARIRNNPVKMAMIRRSVEETKIKENSSDKKKKKKHGDKKSSRKKHSSRSNHSDDDSEETDRGRNSKNGTAKNENHASGKLGSGSEDEAVVRENQRKSDREIRGKETYEKSSRNYRDVRGRSDSNEDVRERGSYRRNDREGRENGYNGSRHQRGVRRGSDSEEEYRGKGSQIKEDREYKGNHDSRRESKQYIDVRHNSDVSRETGRHHKDPNSRIDRARDTEIYSGTERKNEKSMHNDHSLRSQSDHTRQEKKPIRAHVPAMDDVSGRGPDTNLQNRRKKAPKLSEEERAARLREMQLDAEVHEEQRWKRLKKADEDDAKEAAQAAVAKGKNFLDVAKKSVYGAEQGGSATIEESVRRRSHYLQGRSAADAGNAFRR